MDEQAPPSENPFVECPNLGVRRKKLPKTLVEDIDRFKLEGYARKYFAERKTGLFSRKPVPIETLIQWTRVPITRPLTTIDKKLNGNAVQCFRWIQQVMGDQTMASKHSKAEKIRQILNLCISRGGLRDEVYAQLARQLSNNPSRASRIGGWNLMCCACTAFPPSKNLELYLAGFLERHLDSSDEEIAVLSRFSLKKLKKSCGGEARGRELSLLEVGRLIELPFSMALFDETLDTIMENEHRLDPGLEVPRIQSFLIDAIVSLGGTTTEGVFRISGESAQVVKLKIRLEHGDYSLDSSLSPHVPASLLKLWLRELSEPLVPSAHYEACIRSTDPLETLSLLPRHSQSAIRALVPLLQTVAENEATTRMGADSLAIVFAPSFFRCSCPQKMFENNALERAFINALIRNP